MLGRLILVLVQLIVGWYASHALMTLVKFNDFRLYIFAVIAAVVVFLIGVLGSLILRGVGQPGSATLSMSLIFALVAALLWSFGPELVGSLPWGKVKPTAAVMVAAVLGYLVKR